VPARQVLARVKSTEPKGIVTRVTGGGGGLPLPLLEIAASRLQLVSLLMAGAFVVVMLLRVLLVGIFWDGEPRSNYPIPMPLILAGISIGMFLIARFARLAPQTLLDIGLLYQIVMAAGIAHPEVFELWHYQAAESLGISWVCVWVTLYPLIVPNTRSKILLASLVAASMGPISYVWMAAQLGHTVTVELLIEHFLANYIAAGLAMIPAIVMYKMAADVSKAREMGSYRLVELLGRGGMGEVWRAEHRLLARPAAIKLIRPEVLGAEDTESGSTALARFEREAQATSALRSPHTVEVFDFGVTEDGTFYYVMELLDGLDLDSLVQQHGPVPAARAAALLLQACESLAEAHHAGLVHRDIKPANIYACRYGLQHDFVKVLDFGLVKESLAGGGDDSASLTREGVTTGTPAFLAPEMAVGRKVIDTRADLYSLGCVGYWLLSGELVFAEQTAMEMIISHVRETPPPLTERTENEVPEAIERAIMWCLEKKPEARPQSVMQLADRLEAAVAESGLTGAWNRERARTWWETHAPQPRSERTLRTAPDDSPMVDVAFRAQMETTASDRGPQPNRG
jgi:serine/threonine-protein kinase